MFYIIMNFNHVYSRSRHHHQFWVSYTGFEGNKTSLRRSIYYVTGGSYWKCYNRIKNIKKYFVCCFWFTSVFFSPYTINKKHNTCCENSLKSLCESYSNEYPQHISKDKSGNLCLNYHSYQFVIKHIALLNSKFWKSLVSSVLSSWYAGFT